MNHRDIENHMVIGHWNDPDYLTEYNEDADRARLLDEEIDKSIADLERQHREWRKRKITDSVLAEVVDITRLLK